jgi:hypothetical protein
MRSAAIVLVLLAWPGAASGHWSIVSRLTAGDAGRTFDLTLHYELLAGQPNPDEALRVCFWLERLEDNRHVPITSELCQPITLRPNEWRTLTYSLETLPWKRHPRPGGRLPVGRYRAVARIQSDVNPLVRLLLGASQDRQILPFQVE